MRLYKCLWIGYYSCRSQKPTQNGHSPRQRDFFTSIEFTSMADGARNTIPFGGITPPDFVQVLSRRPPYI